MVFVAAACGGDVRRVNHLSIVFSALRAGVAGALDAVRLAVVRAESLYRVTSGQAVIMTLLGGAAVRPHRMPRGNSVNGQ